MKRYYVYMLANEKRGKLYIGVTGDLIKRVYEHRNEVVEGFTKKYRVHKLVHYEETSDVTSAIGREKQLKNWRRSWKINWIEQHNPEWIDLYDAICGQ